MPVSPEPRVLPEVPGILTAAQVAETAESRLAHNNEIVKELRLGRRRAFVDLA